MRLPIAAAVLAFATSSRPADACSMLDEIRIEPTLVEEVAQSYGIVVVAIDLPRVADHVIPFVAREVFRGPYRVGATFETHGVLDQFPCGGPPFFRTLQYVLYLTKDGAVRRSHPLQPKDMAFRHVLSELVRITSSPSPEAGLREATRVRDSDDAKSLADVIERHFTTPTPHKSFAALWPMLRTADRDHVIYSIGRGGDPEARTFMTQLLHTFHRRVPLPREELQSIVAYFSQVHVPEAAADLLWLQRRSERNWPWRRELDRAVELHRTSPGQP